MSDARETLVHGGEKDTSDSILNTIKERVGLSADYDAFDSTILMNINTAFFALWQLGVGRDLTHPFRITGPEEVWSDFVDDGLIEMCKDEMALRVQLLFDPPTSSFLVDNIKAQIQEFDWRMTVGMDEYNSRGSS